MAEVADDVAELNAAMDQVGMIAGYRRHSTAYRLAVGDPAARLLDGDADMLLTGCERRPMMPTAFCFVKQMARLLSRRWVAARRVLHECPKASAN